MYSPRVWGWKPPKPKLATSREGGGISPMLAPPGFFSFTNPYLNTLLIDGVWMERG